MAGHFFYKYMPEKKASISSWIQINNLKWAFGVRFLVKKKLDGGCMPGKDAEVCAFLSGGCTGRRTISYGN